MFAVHPGHFNLRAFIVCIGPVQKSEMNFFDRQEKFTND